MDKWIREKSKVTKLDPLTPKEIAERVNELFVELRRVKDEMERAEHLLQWAAYDRCISTGVKRSIEAFLKQRQARRVEIE